MTGPGAVVDEVRLGAGARVYAEGWQSWSPTTWYAVGEPAHRPENAVRAAMRFRPGWPPPEVGYQGEGLLVVEPGEGAPARCYAVDARAGVPSLRAVPDGGVLRISTTGDPAQVRLSTAADGNGALAAFGDRFGAGTTQRPAPTVWCSWYRYFEGVTPADVRENLAALDAHGLGVDVVQLDDGWQAGIGDWKENDRFGSLAPLVADIRASGRRAGIWVAPFIASADSELAVRHPEWLVGDAGHNWGAPLHGLDLGRSDVRDAVGAWFRRLADLGFDYVKLDFLYGGALSSSPEDPDGTRAYREGLAVIRDALGPQAYLVGCGAPILPSVGLVDAMRVSPDTFHPEGQDGSTGLRGAMGATARAWQHGRLWVNDADCVVARPSYPLREQWANVVRAVGGLRSFSDRIADLDEPGLALVRDVLASAPPPRPFASPPSPRPSGDGLAAAASPLLELLYPGRGVDVARDVQRLVDRYAPAIAELGERPPPDERTVLLITYGDAVEGHPGEPPLATLHRTLSRHVGDLVTDVHLLPMFPSTSDDGFAVRDHRRLDPSLGSWEDIARLADDYRLMFDFVANHVSASHPWVRAAQAGDDTLAARFQAFDPAFDTSRVVRPRTSPLFHDYPRADGGVLRLWTTFSADQVDLNVANPDTLLELTDVLLGYLARGAAAVRLDAIGFLWKASGTTCMHLPQTHAVVKLWRLIADTVRPGVQLVTETNVPHAENLSYFGDGNDEAHQVYQFALPPLVLHTFVSGSTRVLSEWAATIAPVSGTATFLNFLASHDGIGMRPAEGLLSDQEREALVERVLANGGLVSWRSHPDGSRDVYELNTSYLDALADPHELGRPEVVAAKALAAHAILLSLMGIPAIYYHSLFGSPGDPAAASQSGIARRVNRAQLDAGTLDDEVRTDVRRRLVLDGLRAILDVRRRHAAFSPYHPQHVEFVDDRVFAVRRSPGTNAEVLCLVNVTAQEVAVPDLLGTDLITGRTWTGVLPPYGYVWLGTTGGAGPEPA